MQVYPYNISPRIKVGLGRIRILRQRILAEIISREEEAQLKWNARLSNIYWSLAIAGGKLTRRELADLVRQESYKKELSEDESEAINYKNTLDYINESWYVNPKIVSPTTVLALYTLACQPGLKKIPAKFAERQNQIKLFLDYLQAGNENPIVQAGIAQAQLRIISPFENYNGKISRLLGQLFLYKYGYDFRGMLVTDEYWMKDLNSYRQAIRSASVNQNLTIWLEYYVAALVDQLEKAVEMMRSPIAAHGVGKIYFELNERQKAIMTILDDPEEKITNREVQKEFKVSQITASRDMAKLTNLSLVSSRGKGRSVYYVKV